MNNVTLKNRRVHRPRVMPVLLIKSDGLLYKTQKFKNEKYVGDPRIAVKIFNDKGADEIVLLDITATKEKRKPNFSLIEEIAGEAFMPMAYGGGVSSFDDAKTLFSLGVEKVVLNSAHFDNLALARQIADFSGAQSVVISIDFKKTLFGKTQVFSNSGRKNHRMDPVEAARQAEMAGAGEIFLNSIDRDGMFTGYDIDICRAVSDAVTIPVVACGGAGKIADCATVVREAGVSAVAAGSIFVFQGPHRAVLIKFPSDSEMKSIFA